MINRFSSRVNTPSTSITSMVLLKTSRLREAAVVTVQPRCSRSWIRCLSKTTPLATFVERGLKRGRPLGELSTSLSRSIGFVQSSSQRTVGPIIKEQLGQ